MTAQSRTEPAFSGAVQTSSVCATSGSVSETPVRRSSNSPAVAYQDTMIDSRRYVTSRVFGSNHAYVSAPAQPTGTAQSSAHEAGVFSSVGPQTPSPHRGVRGHDGHVARSVTGSPA